MRHAVPNPNPRRRKRERSETRKRRGMHSGTCWGRTGAATPKSGRSDRLNGTKDCIKQNGAKEGRQTRKGGRTEERRRVLRARAALRYFAAKRAVSAEWVNPERGGAKGKPERSLEHKYQRKDV